MTYAPGPWIVVARDSDGHDREWCGHRHDNGDEANECIWRPSDPDWRVCCRSIEYLDDFDPDAAVPCVHVMHPAECRRCRALMCIHMNSPEECERCVQLESGSAGDSAGDARATEEDSGEGDQRSGQATSESTTGPDREGAVE